MIVSFAKTTDALLAGFKRRTRRDWSQKHAAKFHAGMVVDAWNTVPRNVRGNPHKVATIRLTADPYQENSGAFLAGDLLEESAEGFLYMIENGMGDAVADIEEDWLSRPRLVWVVDFEVVEYLEGPLA